MPHRGIESDVENYRRNRRCRWNHFLCGNEEWSRTRKIVVATDAAGGPFFFAATKIRIGRSRPSQQQKLESAAEIVSATAAAGGPFFFDATKISIGRGRSMPLRP